MPIAIPYCGADCTVLWFSMVVFLALTAPYCGDLYKLYHVRVNIFSM